jgi:DNA-binding transcriptional LysR family regulator
MELRHLRYFAAVAAHGSFSRAANNLHLTQPALSRQVKDLEDELGVALLDRGKNLVTLTAAGELFYEEARDLLARADQAVRRVRGDARGEVLRVGYVPSLTAGIIPRAIAKFQTATPRVRLELSDLAPREMSERASAGSLDLVILPAGLEAATREFSWSVLRRLSTVLVMPRTHPLARLKKIPPARLRGVPLQGLGRVDFPEYAPNVRAFLKPFGVTPNFVSQAADGLSSLFAALEANNGATLLTDGIASVLPRTLTFRPFAPALAQTVLMVGLPSVRPSPHAEAFLRLLQEEVAQMKIKR